MTAYKVRVPVTCVLRWHTIRSACMYSKVQQGGRECLHGAHVACTLRSQPVIALLFWTAVLCHAELQALRTTGQLYSSQLMRLGADWPSSP